MLHARTLTLCLEQMKYLTSLARHNGTASLTLKQDIGRLLLTLQTGTRPSGLSPFALATTPSLTVFGSPVIPTASAPRHNQLSVRTSPKNKNRNKPPEHPKQNKQAGTGEGMKLLGFSAGAGPCGRNAAVGSGKQAV